MRIRILPDRVANQIAAGEVVERPASVVKELVENALDADASRIEIALRNGGKTEIRVSDDGIGMEREDALLALDRHATSKIREAEDLGRISSFGFRGEALPSIAAVSRFQLETAPRAGGAPGTRLRVDSGRVRSADEIARRGGTTVRVRGLFRNVPARAGFLRSARAETRACSEAVILLALTNLGVSFLLESNGRELLRLPGSDSLRSRVAEIWGREEAAELLRMDHTEGEVRVAGLVQRPDSARRRGARRHLFVNGRPFRDAALGRAVDEAYRTTIASGIHPAFLLYLSVPPGKVDVNVHPAKAEVRFRDRLEMEAAVRAAVRGRLADLESTATMDRAPEPAGERTHESAGGRRHESSTGRDRESTGHRTREPAPEYRDVDAPGGASEAGQLAFFVSGDPGEGRETEPGAAVAEAGAAEADPSSLRTVRPRLWQLHASYILASTRDGLLIIDQHAAHERILFEEVMARFGGAVGDEYGSEGRGGEGASQRLLFPITLRLAPEEYGAVEELSGLLRKIGFEVESFGDRTVIISASPNPHPRFDPERCFREMIHELTHGSPLVNSARNQHERIAKSLACKGAIKANQALSQEEMTGLVDRLFATELPGHDVHGRPTIVRLGVEELERRFGRT